MIFAAGAHLVFHAELYSSQDFIWFKFYGTSLMFLGALLVCVPAAIFLKSLLSADAPAKAAAEKGPAKGSRSAVCRFIETYSAEYAKIISQVSYTLKDEAIAAFNDKTGRAWCAGAGEPDAQVLLADTFDIYSRVTGQVAQSVARRVYEEAPDFSRSESVSDFVNHMGELAVY